MMWLLAMQCMSTTLANHNEIFLNSLTNAIKEAFNQSGGSRGPVYTNHNTGRIEAATTNVVPPGNGG